MHPNFECRRTSRLTSVGIFLLKPCLLVVILDCQSESLSELKDLLSAAARVILWQVPDQTHQCLSCGHNSIQSAHRAVRPSNVGQHLTASRRAMASLRWCPVSLGLRPSLTPRATARALPSPVSESTRVQIQQGHRAPST